MNNLNLILDKISADCDARIGRVNADKAEKIAEIGKAADGRVSDVLSRAEGAALKEYESCVSRAESSGKLAAREIILEAKSSLVEQVYSAAEEFIYSLPEEKYVLVLSRLLANAIIDRQNSVNSLIEKYGEEEYGDEL